MPDQSRSQDQFAAPLLRAVSAAFRKRSKALKHGFLSFSVAREAGEPGVTPEESLVVEAQRANECFRLRVWPDGALWFWVGRPQKRRWAFQASIHGQLAEPLPNTLVRLFETSKLSGYTAADGASVAAELLEIWAEVGPSIDHAA